MTTHPASTRTATTTRRRRIRAALLVAVAALVLSVQGVNPISEVLGRQLTPTETIAASATGRGSGGGNNGNGGGNSGNNGNGNGNAPFTIAGNTADLAPGVERPLHLTISNTQNFAIIVKTVTVTVSGSDKAGCTAANATATGFTGSLTVPKNGTAPLTLAVRMVADPADECQGAKFALTYSGTGVKR